MTLQEKLKMRRNLGQNIKPIHTAKGIWQYIRMELETFSSIELPMGITASIEVERKEGGLEFKKFICDSREERSSLPSARIPLDKDCLSNLENEMVKVGELAKREGCQMLTVKEDDYIAWGFDVLLM